MALAKFSLALKAGYIPPNVGNDPVRDPSVMPTGKNMVSFDPRKVPDKAAWEIGKKCADDLLAAYYTEHGSYPESVGVVLWAVETMRTKGQSVVMIMRLLGIEPVWDATGKVKSYKITSIQDLGRPRIDVVVTASSLFRDTFSNVMTLLDKAIRELAINTDNGQDNYIKKNYEALKSEYLSQGKSVDDAEFLAASRVYSEKPGSQGNGMAEKIGATESWNTRRALIVMAAMDIGVMMLEISALSFLGLGAQPPTPEWGYMLSEGRNNMQTEPWLMIYPGIAIFITVMIFNLLGDGLRDILDPNKEY